MRSSSATGTRGRSQARTRSACPGRCAAAPRTAAAGPWPGPSATCSALRSSTRPADATTTSPHTAPSARQARSTSVRPSRIASALSLPKRLDAPPATTTPASGVLASRVFELDSGGTMLERFLLLSVVFALAMSMPAGAQSPRVTMTTSLGKIVVELDSAKAPKTVENFLRYVDEKFYDGTIFHRVIASFMIQGGGFTKDMMQKS